MTSLTLPSAPAPQDYRFYSHQPSKWSRATSGRILSRAHGGQAFRLSLSYAPMTRAQFAPISAFLAGLEGRNSIFNVAIPADMAGESGLHIGNYATYSNDTKLHVITALGPTEVSPPARYPGGTLTTSGIHMRCSLSSDLQEFSLGRSGLIAFKLELTERP